MGHPRTPMPASKRLLSPWPRNSSARPATSRRTENASLSNIFLPNRSAPLEENQLTLASKPNQLQRLDHAHMASLMSMEDAKRPHHPPANSTATQEPSTDECANLPPQALKYALQ